MRARFYFWLTAALGTANAALIVFNATIGSYWLVPVNTLAAGLNLFYAHRFRKEIRDGRHRQAEEGPRDPGSFAAGGIITSPVAVSIGSLRAYTSAERTRPGVDLERVQSDLPILAHRVARLAFGQQYPFLPYTGRAGFGADASAVCDRMGGYAYFETVTHTHRAPAVDCTCGFHALPPDVEPWGVGPHLVTLLVELSGVVVEHERGYRAEHQRVVEVQIPPCPMCGDAAQWVQVEDGHDTATFGMTVRRGKHMSGVACDRHREGETVTIDDVRRLLGLPVTCQSLPVPTGHEGDAS